VCYLDDTAFPGGKGFANNFLETDSILTGKFGINYNMSANELLYATWSRGGKAGGYNSGYVAGTSKTLPSFKPETDLDYELGLKSTFLDQHMRLQADIFDMDYQAYQVAVPNIVNGVAIPPTPVANIAGAKDYGFELQLQAQLGRLRLDVNGAYLQTILAQKLLWDSRYNLFVQLEGHNLPNAPHLTGNFDAEYAFPMGGAGGSLTPRVQISYTGGQYWTVFDNSDTSGANRDWTGGFATVNLDLSIIPSGSSPWLIELYAQNAFNRLYLAGIASTANDKAHTGNDTWLYGAPQTYGFRATYNF
jgi:iron complex outermembrane receptor protein